MYAGGSAVITVDDVRKLSAQVQEARVFDLTDALAQRNRKQALDILHDLLADGEAPLRLISTITSQVRSLILVKELSQKGIRAAEIASTAGLIGRQFRRQHCAYIRSVSWLLVYYSNSSPNALSAQGRSPSLTICVWPCMNQAADTM